MMRGYHPSDITAMTPVPNRQVASSEGSPGCRQRACRRNRGRSRSMQRLSGGHRRPVTVRKVTTRLLERHGYEVITAKDGVDAITILQEKPA